MNESRRHDDGPIDQRLLDAAPDLLAACDAAIRLLYVLPAESVEHRMYRTTVYRMLEEALVKATGTAPGLPQ